MPLKCKVANITPSDPMFLRGIVFATKYGVTAITRGWRMIFSMDSVPEIPPLTPVWKTFERERDKAEPPELFDKKKASFRNTEGQRQKTRADANMGSLSLL